MVPDVLFGGGRVYIKNFTDKEFEMIINLLHKKLLHKKYFWRLFSHVRTKTGGIAWWWAPIASSKNTSARRHCKKTLDFILFLIQAQSMAVLKKFKVDLVFIDSTVAGMSECSFIAKARKIFPNIEIFVISRNYLERHRFLISGADRFFIAQMGVEQIAESVVGLLKSFCFSAKTGQIFRILRQL